MHSLMAYRTGQYPGPVLTSTYCCLPMVRNHFTLQLLHPFIFHTTFLKKSFHCSSTYRCLRALIRRKIDIIEKTLRRAFGRLAAFVAVAHALGVAQFEATKARENNELHRVRLVRSINRFLQLLS